MAAGLAGYAAAGDGADDIEPAEGVGDLHRLADDELQGLETEVLVNITAVNGDLAVPGYILTRATECFLLPVP